MNKVLQQWVQQVTNAKSCQCDEVIQSLWSGYGEIIRLRLEGLTVPSVVLKHIRFPDEARHPHGWHSDFSHQRKVRSYEVETHWYQAFSQYCDARCRAPWCYQTTTLGEEHLILLEDLDAAGFSQRKTWLNKHELNLCLRWLAHFHATFLGVNTEGLWPTGSYWHLETRPDEWKAMPNTALKQAAKSIDAELEGCQFKSLIHGDAKVENFCFSDDGRDVAAVDFQYVGGGCGMKDVAYLIGSCLDERQEETWEDALLDTYFTALRKSLSVLKKDVDTVAMEKEWRGLFPVAQADFSRFLAGWRPDHWKVNRHNQRISQEVAKRLLILDD
ncbi:MAG: phosphotransferase [Mariprofundaceae bacterium]|nr:phosphotransferase [Mariprofundaceae bacterium]